ncbi:MAG: Type 1 glutamine amidotransferase-like domain-containing protein [bacterium]
MKLYLSSYKLGDSGEKLKLLLENTNHQCAYISNALDYSTDLVRRSKHEKRDMQYLTELGLQVDLLDLREYFDKQDHLEKKLSEYAMVWISGGNVFVLRQAMKLSGFDEIILKFNKEKSEFVYAGYSAAVCVLSPNFKGMEIVDPEDIGPYYSKIGTIWQGLSIIDFNPVVHYQSDHPESEDANKELQFYIDNKIKYKTLRDGDMIIIV